MTALHGAAIKGAGGGAAHPDEVAAAHRRALAGASAQDRYVEIVGGRHVHAIEAGNGKPLVLLHGSGPAALLFLPLLERLKDVRAIAVDRPGFGLSDPIDRPLEPYRASAIDTVTRILDALGVARAALLGNSTGGAWALWFALAHPDRVSRLVLVGATPSLPGTHVPPPMLAVAAPPCWAATQHACPISGDRRADDARHGRGGHHRHLSGPDRRTGCRRFRPPCLRDQSRRAARHDLSDWVATGAGDTARGAATAHYSDAPHLGRERSPRRRGRRADDSCHDPPRAVGGALSGSRALAWPPRSGGHVGERLPASRPVTDRRTRLLESGSRVVQPATPNLCASSAARRR